MLRPLCLGVILCLAPIGSGYRVMPDVDAQPARGRHGGRLVISKTAEPRTFNRLFAFDDQTAAISNCLAGHLIRINRQTQQLEPELAQSWRVSRDGRRVTFSLRPGVKFSDGRLMSADDVIFTFQVINDSRVATVVSDQFNFQGQRVKAEKVDAGTVSFVFPLTYAAALRLFDGIPILPRHALEAAYREGKLEQVWGAATPADQIVGLGPFKLRAYTPGERVVLSRNEHYWKKTASGEQLPFLDELVFAIDRDRNTQLLKFQRGETDILSPVNAEDLKSLAALESGGRVKVHDLGPSLIREIFWFNLNDGKQSSTGRSPVDPIKVEWFKEVKFRLAVSHAIDRQSIVNLVFAGKATPQWGFLSAGDRFWCNAAVTKQPYDLNRARQLLTEAGFVYRADQRSLVDRQGRAVNFTLITNAGNALRQKISALIQADLAKIGIRVTLAAIDARALLGRINDSFDYEAGLLAIVSGDLDPSSHMSVLSSHGAGHWWYPKQTRPGTTWETRIDELMRQQMTMINAQTRKKLFDEVQGIMAEQQPFIFLASRHLIVAAKTNIGGLKPVLLPDFVLWNCEELYRSS